MTYKLYTAFVHWPSVKNTTDQVDVQTARARDLPEVEAKKKRLFADRNDNKRNPLEEFLEFLKEKQQVQTFLGCPLSGKFWEFQLKKFYLDGRGSSFQLANPLPSLETFGQLEWTFTNAFEGLENQLKVVISRHFSSDFLQLTNLEKLHVTFLAEEDDKPRVFVGRLPKLLLLDIFHIYREDYMNELLEEVNSLKPARNVKFYHNGIDSSVYINEKLRNPDLFEYLLGMMDGGGSIDLKRMFSVVHQKPELVLPFFYFHHTFGFWNYREISLSRPFPFGILKNFSRNINKIVIDEILSFDELRSLLTNFRHLLVFIITCDELDQAFDRFFDDLPGILENLIILDIFTGDLVLENLNFLNGFKQLLGFAAKYRENEENRKTIQTIEERKKKMKYPILAEALDHGHLCEQGFFMKSLVLNEDKKCE